MALVHLVARSRKVKNKRICQICGNGIQPPEPYFWWENRYSFTSRGHRKFTCHKHPPKPSMTVASGKVSSLLAIGEHVEDGLSEEDFDEAFIGLLVEHAGQAAHEVADEYEESAGNMESGFGFPTSTSEALRDRAEEISTWADSEPNLPEPPEYEQPSEDLAHEDPEYHEDATEAWENWREQARQAARDWMDDLDSYGG